MSLFNKPTARAAIIALAAAISTGGLALHSAPQAQAMPVVKPSHAVSQDSTAMVHQARVRQPTGRKFIRGQNGRYKEVRTTTRQDGPVIRDHRARVRQPTGRKFVLGPNGRYKEVRTTTRQDGPVIRDHRAPNPARRVPYSVSR